MKLEIITPTTHLVYDDIHYVSLPSIQGECGILPQHVHMAVTLQEGILQYRKADGTTSCTIHAGVAIVKENKVQVLTESVEV